MLNSVDSEKSRGVLLFAFNTDLVNYVLIAERAARLIKHNLNLPVTLVTDTEVASKYFDTVVIAENTLKNIRNGYAGGTQWRNGNRYQAYELSPYDETLLLDSDYLVLDKSLLALFSTEFDYKLMHHNVTDDGPSYEQMGETSLPFVWATVVLFRKTERSRLLFSLVGRIQRNYSYYRMLYNIKDRNYRNDFAFAIANIILNGYNTNEDHGIPWPMYTVDKPINKIMLTDTQVHVHYNETATVIPYQNIHVMDKEYLLSRDFEQVVEAICEPT